ncbi:hypothetical protein M413DRAFT_239552 [Hebeloma cylindrosporum]|uniref:Uncharacterized protein n=1 Tax=Hebeloma cylindrosporum TaxID=76867 RepID=A0A0C3C5S1_HEBCY|nr:hypothetical protein M413DRAFT_239552 [Hebeloma cylindrosporum h7]
MIDCHSFPFLLLSRCGSILSRTLDSGGEGPGQGELFLLSALFAIARSLVTSTCLPFATRWFADIYTFLSDVVCYPRPRIPCFLLVLSFCSSRCAYFFTVYSDGIVEANTLSFFIIG